MYILLLPALAFVLFSAHLLFHGWGLLVSLIPSAALLLWFVPRRIVARLSQAALVVFALEWVRAGVLLAQTRLASGEPWIRALAILLAVALFTLLTALAFQRKRVLEHFAR